MTPSTRQENQLKEIPPPDRERLTEELPSYVDAKGFRNRLCLSDRAFRRGLSAGRIPPPDLRWGRALRWRVETVQAFFEELEAREQRKTRRGA